MNIIKFKDTVVPNQEWYNNNLRGKYAYWIRCQYVVPLESIPVQACVSFETTINNLLAFDYYRLIQNEETGIYTYEIAPIITLSVLAMRTAVLVEDVPVDPTEDSPLIIKIDRSIIKYIDMLSDENQWILAYIDISETDKINDVSELKIINSFVPDDDITMDELRRFRTWIAENLLNIKSDITDEQKHILEYYTNGMIDDVMKWLNVFGEDVPEYSTGVSGSTCGCGSGTNLSSLYRTTTSVCDSVSIYKNNIKTGMIHMFSEIDFWKTSGDLFLKEIVKYLKGILKANLPLTNTSPNDNLVYSCDCLHSSDESQKTAQALLNDLIDAFEYIIDNNITGNKLFISNTFTKWADGLYESMQWV